MADARDILADLTSKFDERKQAGEYDEQLDEVMTGKVIPAWQANSPAGYDEYIDSIQVTRPARAGEGQVGATVDYANIVEDGSENVQGFSPRRKTETQLNRGGK